MGVLYIYLLNVAALPRSAVTPSGIAGWSQDPSCQALQPQVSQGVLDFVINTKVVSNLLGLEHNHTPTPNFTGGREHNISDHRSGSI